MGGDQLRPSYLQEILWIAELQLASVAYVGKLPAFGAARITTGRLGKLLETKSDFFCEV